MTNDINTTADPRGFTVVHGHDAEGLGRRRPSVTPSVAGCDVRQRTPAEIAEQLMRDAVSLELTGQSFAKDEDFYKTVAANLREAAAKLGRWDTTLQERDLHHERQVLAAERAVMGNAIFVAGRARDMASALSGAGPDAWRAASDAIIRALEMRQAGYEAGQ